MTKFLLKINNIANYSLNFEFLYLLVIIDVKIKVQITWYNRIINK